jgi:hypothetical protein
VSDPQTWLSVGGGVIFALVVFGLLRASGPSAKKREGDDGGASGPLFTASGDDRHDGSDGGGSDGGGGDGGGGGD